MKIINKSVANIKLKLEGLQNNLKILDPENVLKRGFTITSLNGRIIKSAASVNIDDVVETQFSDGKVGSKVIKKGN